jgi:hypothetical protein
MESDAALRLGELHAPRASEFEGDDPAAEVGDDLVTDLPRGAAAACTQRVGFEAQPIGRDLDRVQARGVAGTRSRRGGAPVVIGLAGASPTFAERDDLVVPAITPEA